MESEIWGESLREIAFFTKLSFSRFTCLKIFYSPWLLCTYTQSINSEIVGVETFMCFNDTFA